MVMKATSKAMEVVQCVCPLCGIMYTVEVPYLEYHAYKNSFKPDARPLLIQDAMPDVDPAIRESIKTGICSDCWNDMFGDN